MPQNKPPEFFPAYRLVAQFADGCRLTFDGFTYEQAYELMAQAQDEHGDISWYDGVTDEHYESGVYHAAVPAPPRFPFPLIEDPDNPTQTTIFDPGE